MKKYSAAELSDGTCDLTPSTILLDTKSSSSETMEKGSRIVAVGVAVDGCCCCGDDDVMPIIVSAAMFGCAATHDVADAAAKLGFAVAVLILNLPKSVVDDEEDEEDVALRPITAGAAVVAAAAAFGTDDVIAASRLRRMETYAALPVDTAMLLHSLIPITPFESLRLAPVAVATASIPRVAPPSMPALLPPSIPPLLLVAHT